MPDPGPKQADAVYPPTAKVPPAGCRRSRPTDDDSRRESAQERTLTALTIELPDQLVEEARDAGLLSPEAIETMLRERLRKQGIDELFDATRRLAATPDEPVMSLEEI